MTSIPAPGVPGHKTLGSRAGAHGRDPKGQRIGYPPIGGRWFEVASWSVFAVRSDTSRAFQ